MVYYDTVAIEKKHKNYFIYFPIQNHEFYNVFFRSKAFPINESIVGGVDEDGGSWRYKVGVDNYLLESADDITVLYKNNEQIFMDAYYDPKIKNHSKRIQKAIDAMLNDISRRKEEIRHGFDSLRRTDFFRQHNFSLNPAHGPGREIRDFL